MFRLTREVRFAINPDASGLATQHRASNGFGGFPALTGFGQFYRLSVTIEGELEPDSGYLLNIKQIDKLVRERIVRPSSWPLSPQRIYETLLDGLGNRSLVSVSLHMSPFLCLTQLSTELGMHTRMSQKFEFSAAHRLHNPRLSDEDNRRVYGKCNNPNGHGHNYELQVTLRGKPDANGLLAEVPAFEKIVKEHVLDRLDHKHLNVDVTEFRELIPTVENIAMVIYRLLKGRFSGIGADLASVTVWETPKTWCEYSEDK
jgi:6-pyruvoyltetrahydropterin/6-carboxytetrahydropterin synthase